MSTQPNPSYIMQTATGFWASKVLLTAVELDLFSSIGDEAVTASQLGELLGLHPRGTYDFFDAMAGFQAANFHRLAEQFDISRYKTVGDVGGALALLSRIVGTHHQHLTFSSFDLPAVAPHT